MSLDKWIKRKVTEISDPPTRPPTPDRDSTSVDLNDTDRPIVIDDISEPEPKRTRISASSPEKELDVDAPLQPSMSTSKSSRGKKPMTPASGSGGTAKHRGTGFDKEWLKTYKWVENREGVGMFCKLCIKHGQHATRGTRYWTEVPQTTFRVESLKNHQKSAVHIVTVGMEGQREAAKHSGGIKAAMAKQLTLQEFAFMSAMRCMYWLLKENIPYTTKYKSLLSLVRDLGCTYLDALNIDKVTNYTSERTMQEMVWCIGETVKRERLETLRASPVFSVLCDESTDITVTEQLLIYIKYIDRSGDTNVTFLGAEEMRSCTADAITAKLVGFLESEGLDINKMAGFGSDGASTMTGRRIGVQAQLKRLSPMIISCHCVAHRLALAMGDVGKKVPYVQRFNDALQMLYNFYENSAVRLGGLRTIQEALEDEVLKPKKALTTRWLSHHHACSTMRQIITSVIMSLEREGTERDDIKAIGLHKLICAWRFTATLHTMCDILPKLAELSKKFQLKDLAFSDIQEKITDITEQLQTALVVPGRFYKMRDDVIARMEAVGIKFTNPISDADYKRDIHDKFINAVIQNIEDRFPQAEIMDSFKIFDCDLNQGILPTTLQEAEDSNYGEDGLNALIDHYEEGLGISREAAMTEWVSLRAVMIQHPELYGKLPDALKVVSKSDVYPSLALLAKAAMVIPASTADCERGFSKLKLIKTRLRNRMAQHTLNSLMMANIEGPPVADFPYAKACQIWASLRNRKITLNFEKLLAAPAEIGNDSDDDEDDDEVIAKS